MRVSILSFTEGYTFVSFGLFIFVAVWKIGSRTHLACSTFWGGIFMNKHPPFLGIFLHWLKYMIANWLTGKTNDWSWQLVVASSFSVIRTFFVLSSNFKSSWTPVSETVAVIPKSFMLLQLADVSTASICFFKWLFSLFRAWIWLLYWIHVLPSVRSYIRSECVDTFIFVDLLCINSVISWRDWKAIEQGYVVVYIVQNLYFGYFTPLAETSWSRRSKYNRQIKLEVIVFIA